MEGVLEKSGIFLILISIMLTVILIADKYSENIISDSARILIGLSDKDSFQCNACSVGEKYFEKGCKHCEQDGIFFHVYTSQNQPYSTGWGNDNGLYLGDKNCSGHETFKVTKAKTGDNYWVEVKRNGLQFQTTLFEDNQYSKIVESIKVVMCSNPTDLKYFKISMEDGLPPGNGGRILGYIDDIEIWEGENLIFNESFDLCSDKTCKNQWVINDLNMVYIDIINKNLFFDSQVSGTNDSIHYEMERSLDESWTLRFLFHINELKEYPKNSGFIPLDKISRAIIFWIPMIALPIISIYLFKKNQNKKIKLLLISNFSIIVIAILITIF